MKLYISIPITGRPIAEAKYQAEVIRNKLRLHGHECLMPFDICPESGKPYTYYMGRDIERLLGDYHRRWVPPGSVEYCLPEDALTKRYRLLIRICQGGEVA